MKDLTGVSVFKSTTPPPPKEQNRAFLSLFIGESLHTVLNESARSSYCHLSTSSNVSVTAIPTTTETTTTATTTAAEATAITTTTEATATTAAELAAITANEAAKTAAEVAAAMTTRGRKETQATDGLNGAQTLDFYGESINGDNWHLDGQRKGITAKTGSSTVRQMIKE